MKNHTIHERVWELVIFATLSAMAFAAPAGAQDRGPSEIDISGQETLAPLAQCNAIDIDQERHACFDRVVPQLLSAANDGSVKVVDAEEIDQTRRRLFGFSLPNIPIFSGDDGAELDLLESTITDVRNIGRGTWHFRIAEGDALWRVKSNSVRMKAPRVGDTVVFKSATLGTYFIRINGRKGVRGSRIR